MSKEIEIKRDSDTGRITDIHIKGVKGPACEDIEKIVAELYDVPETSEKTREYHEKTRVNQNQRIKGK